MAPPYDPETKFRRFLIEQLDLLPAIFLFPSLVRTRDIERRGRSRSWVACRPPGVTPDRFLA